MSKQVTIDTLIGETLAYVDVDPVRNEIMLTTASGRIIQIYHDQNCCERVWIESTDGKWHKLVGKVIDTVSRIAWNFKDDDFESRTVSELKFSTSEDTVISRWVGCSNGYYSESVDLRELASYDAADLIERNLDE